MNQYLTYSPDQLEEHLSNFLVNSWSYSKLSQFSRNEKAFEMVYIYGMGSKSSATTIAGQAYHYALENYFISKKEGETLTIVRLEELAFLYIENKESNVWKLQKTTPTVEECKEKALKTVTSLIKNFFSELETYEKDIKEIIDVEVYCDEFLSINGVDIPLPCHAKMDLVVLTNEDKIAIIDHKSKATFSDAQELKLSIGVQAITYINCYETKTGNEVNEVWFIENKYSQNKDKSAQLNCFKVEINEDVRRLYEAILYEPLKRMLTAVNDPDYVYLINESDNFVDKAEIYDFWAKTQIAEIEDFNINPAKQKLIEKRLKKIRDTSIATINPNIIKNFRENAAQFIQYDLSNTDMTEGEKIEHVLRGFGTIVRTAHKFEGYSSNTYLLEASAGVKISSIYSHRLDIANALDVANVRISPNLIVHEGKSFVGVEFTKKRSNDLIFNPQDLHEMKIPIGKDNFGNTVVWDLNNHATPHVLICGATGSGKSVCVRSTIEYAKLCGVEKIVILDPKFEFLKYSMFAKVINDITEIETEMMNLIVEMNDLIKAGKQQKTLVIFDEFADALAQSRSGNELKIYETVVVGNYAKGGEKTKRECTGEYKSLEENLRILLQKGRSVGFRIMAATQRASVKVITGDAKVNFPVQICFRVPKEADSRVVIDESGAESLNGLGDGLMKSPEYRDTVRFQGYFKL